MSIHVALSHVTHYRYAKSVDLGLMSSACGPPPLPTPILNYSFKITPEEHFINWQQDPQGNFQARSSFRRRPTN